MKRLNVTLTAAQIAAKLRHGYFGQKPRIGTADLRASINYYERGYCMPADTFAAICDYIESRFADGGETDIRNMDDAHRQMMFSGIAAEARHDSELYRAQLNARAAA
jgi:UDP-glucose 6-dehydrogenase